MLDDLFLIFCEDRLMWVGFFFLILLWFCYYLIGCIFLIFVGKEIFGEGVVVGFLEGIVIEVWG